MYAKPAGHVQQIFKISRKVLLNSIIKPKDFLRTQDYGQRLLKSLWSCGNVCLEGDPLLASFLTLVMSYLSVMVTLMSGSVDLCICYTSSNNLFFFFISFSLHYVILRVLTPNSLNLWVDQWSQTVVRCHMLSVLVRGSNVSSVLQISCWDLNTMCHIIKKKLSRTFVPTLLWIYFWFDWLYMWSPQLHKNNPAFKKSFHQMINCSHEQYKMVQNEEALLGRIVKVHLPSRQSLSVS